MPYKDKEYGLSQGRKYRAEHREELRARQRERDSSYWKENSVKKCIKCGEEKKKNDFSIRSSICKACAVKKAKDWALDNKERRIKYITENKDVLREKQRERYMRNREKLLKKYSEYHAANIDSAHARNRRWREDHPEYQAKRYFLKNGFSLDLISPAALELKAVIIDHKRQLRKLRGETK